jgi:hypothetical protein
MAGLEGKDAMKTSEIDALHERVAAVLGWSVADVRSQSLSSLQELARGKDPALDRVIADVRSRGAHMTISDPEEARGHRRRSRR